MLTETPLWITISQFSSLMTLHCMYEAHCTISIKFEAKLLTIKSATKVPGSHRIVEETKLKRPFAYAALIS